jgi:hypothetical protein
MALGKCVYCKGSVPEERVMQICDRCGVKVWGARMFEAILKGTNSEAEKGNLELGRVGEENSREQKFDPRSRQGFRKFE